MTSWRYVTHLFLFVFLSKINLSKEGCYDYFNVNSWARNLTETVSLVKTKHSKDVMECTVERECLQGRNVCHILYHCFQRTVEVQNISEKCEGDTLQTIPFYHFMCLTAKASNHTPKGCEYGTACELYSEKPRTVFDQTTLPPTTAPTTTPPPTTAPTTTPPPTTAPTTTPPPTTTTPPERTTAATTVLPPTAPATTTALPLKAASLPPSPASVTQRAGSGGNGQTLHFKDETDNNNAENKESLTLKILLMISLVLNVVVPLALYLYLRPQRRQDCIDSSGICMLNRASSEAQTVTELKSNTLLVSGNGDEVETSHLMQPPQCDAVIIHSVHMRKDDSVGNDILI